MNDQQLEAVVSSDAGYDKATMFAVIEGLDRRGDLNTGFEPSSQGRFAKGKNCAVVI